MTPGVEKVNGVNCDKWTYRIQDESSGAIDDHAFWCVEDQSIPVATGKIGSTTGGSLYTLFFTNFAPGSPAIDLFNPAEGCSCPASTPPGDDDSRDSAKEGQAIQVSSVNCLHKQAAARN